MSFSLSIFSNHQGYHPLSQVLIESGNEEEDNTVGIEQHSNLESDCSFDRLPKDIKKYVISFIDYETSLQLRRASKKCKEVVDEALFQNPRHMERLSQNLAALDSVVGNLIREDRFKDTTGFEIFSNCINVIFGGTLFVSLLLPSRFFQHTAKENVCRDLKDFVFHFLNKMPKELFESLTETEGLYPIGYESYSIYSFSNATGAAQHLTHDVAGLPEGLFTVKKQHDCVGLQVDVQKEEFDKRWHASLLLLATVLAGGAASFLVNKIERKLFHGKNYSIQQATHIAHASFLVSSAKKRMFCADESIQNKLNRIESKVKSKKCASLSAGVMKCALRSLIAISVFYLTYNLYAYNSEEDLYTSNLDFFQNIKSLFLGDDHSSILGALDSSMKGFVFSSSLLEHLNQALEQFQFQPESTATGDTLSFLGVLFGVLVLTPRILFGAKHLRSIQKVVSETLADRRR